MLTKNPDGSSAGAERGAPAQRKTARSPSSVIGAGLTITGNLDCKGELQIDGKVEGDIHAERIIIGQGANTTGNLVAEEVQVRGGVQGSIRGNAVEFQSSSRVEADVTREVRGHRRDIDDQKYLRAQTVVEAGIGSALLLPSRRRRPVDALLIPLNFLAVGQRRDLRIGRRRFFDRFVTALR